MKLGYLGPIGTFSFEASKKYYSESELIGYKTITDVIMGLMNNEVDRAIVPIENSIQGGVTQTIDTLIENDGVFVNKEIILDVNHYLMGNRRYKLEEIKEIYSHPQAIAQCRKYLEKNFKNIVIKETASTGYAAKQIEKKDFCVCIGNLSCAEEYNLVVLDKNIQDDNMNKTKFWVLSKENKDLGNKMALVFSTLNTPGALYEVLGVFYNNKINLTKIESRPSKIKFGSYIFLVELEINDNVNKCLDLIKEKCEFFKTLGRY